MVERAQHDDPKDKGKFSQGKKEAPRKGKAKAAKTKRVAK